MYSKHQVYTSDMIFIFIFIPLSIEYVEFILIHIPTHWDLTFLSEEGDIDKDIHLKINLSLVKRYRNRELKEK